MHNFPGNVFYVNQNVIFITVFFSPTIFAGFKTKFKTNNFVLFWQVIAVETKSRISLLMASIERFSSPTLGKWTCSHFWLGDLRKYFHKVWCLGLEFKDWQWPLCLALLGAQYLFSS